MYKYLPEYSREKVIREVIEFVKDVPPDLIRKMERGEIDFPREFIEELVKEIYWD